MGTAKLTKLFSIMKWVVPMTLLVYSGWSMTERMVDQYENKQTYGALRFVYQTPHEEQQPSQQDNPPKSTAESSKSVSEVFRKLLLINPDIVGWIQIAGTNIDYPVVKASNNSFYLDHDVTKKPNKAGSIFMDFRNRTGSDGGDRHTILYGHNMRDRSMFTELLKYESPWFYETNTQISFNTIDQPMVWKIFAVYRTYVSFDYIRTEFQSDIDFMEFVTEISRRSMHKEQVIVQPEDQILTLSTCTNIEGDERFVVHAVLVKS